MRLDKFLQISRLVKRRNAANALCSRGNVILNNHPAKPGKVVNVGDHITIITDPLPTEEQQELTYEILDVPSGNVSKSRATSLYRVIK